MNQKTTNAQIRLKELELSKHEIMRVLKWDEETYCSFQYEEGLKYLEAYIEEREHQLTRSATFWKWWRNMWAFRDEHLLIDGLDQMRREDAEELYKEMHNGIQLSSNIHPNRALLDRTYSEMITEFTREELSSSPKKVPQNGMS